MFSQYRLIDYYRNITDLKNRNHQKIKKNYKSRTYNGIDNGFCNKTR